MKPDDVQGKERAVPKLTRCAIYARYSCDLSRPASIEDQVRKCTQECQRHDGWTIIPEWVVSDQAVSGRSLAGRDAMESLKRAAKKKPRPFDCVLIDDTSRFGRNLGDVLKLAEFFKHYGVSLHFVSPPLDSNDPNFHLFLVFKGMMDEQYSVDLAYKVRRGQEGRVLAGFNAGGPCYGYRNVPALDSDGKREIGVQLEIIPEQKAVVQGIFEMYANGGSFDGIAKFLRTANVPPPRPPRKKSVRGWSPFSIGGMLRNKKYIGINERGRTTGGRHPETGRPMTKAVPEEEWVRKENPDWRIVSDELWNRVQAQLELKKKLGIPKQGGLSRTERSQKYLFSGLISCGLCEGPISIIDGTAGGEIVRYGCSNHRYKGDPACTNATTIRRDSLEDQLLRWLTHDLFQSGSLEQAAKSFYTEVQHRVSKLQAEAQKNAVNAPELKKELTKKRQDALTMTEFIVTSGRQSWPTIQAQLATTEARIKEIEDMLARAEEPEPISGLGSDELKEHLLRKLRDLQTALTSSPQEGRLILQRHIRKITLTPGAAGGKRVFQVGVEFNLDGGGDSGVMLNGTLDASLQQYGFSTITVSGLTLDTSRARRKPTGPKHAQEGDGAEAPASPMLATDASVLTIVSDSGPKETHA
jgi:site-specific DNA recombinase